MNNMIKIQALGINSPFLLLLGLITLCGCDPRFNPIDTEKGRYSVYGTLDIDKDVNYIRVKNLNIPLAHDTLKTLDATVTLENLRNGTSEKLQDVVFEVQGVRLHNYRTTMPINPRTPYLLTIDPTEGKEIRALATTPSIAQTQVIPQQIRCHTDFKIVFDPVDPEAGIQAAIEFEFRNDRYTLRSPLKSYITQQNNKAILQLTPHLVLQLVPQLPAIPSRTLCEQLTSDIFTVSYYHFGPGFRNSTTSDSLDIPGGTADFFGFYTDTLTIELDLESEKQTQ